MIGDLRCPTAAGLRLHRKQFRLAKPAKYASCISNIHREGIPMPNRKREEPVVRITVGLDLSDHDRLSRLAGEAGVSLAWMLRRAAREFLDRQEKRRDGAMQIVGLGRKRRA